MSTCVYIYLHGYIYHYLYLIYIYIYIYMWLCRYNVWLCIEVALEDKWV